MSKDSKTSYVEGADLEASATGSAKTGTVNAVASLIHEIRVLLTPIVVSSELLAEEMGPSEDSVSGKLIRSILANARSANNRLLRFVETCKVLNDSHLRLEQIDISEIIRNVAVRLYPLIKSKDQSLDMQVPTSLARVKGDKYFLEQVLLNLLENASKYTPEMGRIRISCRQDANRVICCVNDTGPGIPERAKEKIFDPYFRYGDQRGSDLGLAITKHLVELHSGKLWLENTQSQGCTLCFSLPTDD